MKIRSTRVIVGAGALAGGLALTLGVSAADKKGEQRVARVKDIMAGIHKIHCGAIGKALKGDLDDKGWEEVVVHAAMMNESGHVLMQNKRCPDGVWAKATGTLREGSEAIVVAAKAKDKDAASSAFKVMTGACKACHTAHKK